MDAYLHFNLFLPRFRIFFKLASLLSLPLIPCSLFPPSYLPSFSEYFLFILAHTTQFLLFSSPSSLPLVSSLFLLHFLLLLLRTFNRFSYVLLNLSLSISVPTPLFFAFSIFPFQFFTPFTLFSYPVNFFPFHSFFFLPFSHFLFSTH